MTTSAPSHSHTATGIFPAAAWHGPASGLCRRIDQGGIDLWRVDLAQRTADAWPRALTPDELARAGRFARRELAERFLQCRFALRTLLAAYSGLPMHALPIQVSAQGKPQLPTALALGFNLSHAGGHALIAIGRQRGIGVDIECGVPAGDLKALARQVFSEAEWPVLSPLGGDDLARAFLLGWTRKEACLKALGTGLLLEPDRIDAGLSSGTQRVRPLPARAPVAVTSLVMEAGGQAAPSSAALAVSEVGADRLGAVHYLTFGPHAPWEHD
ncbi:MAG: 4'-phosphopantetheinyl transferase superfamily protein [Rhodocyclaceae bacterium]|nr:MAG: 4'-phosphopantetheinyl transferase superfamily protein [Rhodocyclaceae bacterium]